MNFRISEDLRIIREILDISQVQMAKDIDVSFATILRIENGTNYPNKETINKIYDYAYRKGIKLNTLKEAFYKEEIRGDEKLLFHGAKNFIVGAISPYKGRKKTDFGQGFYCGESLEQTVSFIYRYPDSSLYYLKFNEKGLKKVKFDVNQEWMLAVAYCRGKLVNYENHPLITKIVKKVESADYIIAPIADNRMFIIIDRFINGEITDEQCKHCLAATNLGFQYVFLNEKATSHLAILERCFISNLERKKYEQIKAADTNDGENKVKLAIIKYKNQGKYIEEILG